MTEISESLSEESVFPIFLVAHVIVRMKLSKRDQGKNRSLVSVLKTDAINRR